MEYSDTINLLKECDAGTKMAISAFNEVLENVCNPDLKALLQESKKHHEKIENEINNLLNNHDSEQKEPNTIAKSMSWMKINMKMNLDNSDETVADLITDGCNMGIKSLHKYLNQYKKADASSKEICKRLIDIEQNLCLSLTRYL